MFFFLPYMGMAAKLLPDCIHVHSPGARADNPETKL